MSPALRLTAALAAVYLIWGSTYLAMAYAVDGLPPLLAAALRFFSAGLFLHGYCRWRGVPAPTARQWWHALPIGLLMLVFGNGLVCIAVQDTPTGMAAVIIAVTPAMVVGLPWLAGGPRPRWPAIAGIVLGLAGVVILKGWDGPDSGQWWAVGLIVLACVGWAGGVLAMRRLDQPEDLLQRSALPMLLGGLCLALGGLARGEVGQLHAGPALLPALVATAYLSLCGSVIAYTAYLWLQRHAAPALATSNVYINPLIAVALGFVLRDEPLSAHLVAGGTLILVAVGLLTWDGVRSTAKG